jgi:hypothetical protein
MAMEMFIHQQNILLLRKQLAETHDEVRRVILFRLLKEEEAKSDPTAEPFLCSPPSAQI